MSEAKEYGEPLKYDPEFTGPQKHRSCTDVLCLFIFLVFIAVWAAIGAYAFMNGNTEMLLVPRDSQGSRCGHDSHVLDKPYLFFFDLSKCLQSTLGCSTPQICVKECPTKSYIFTGQDNFQDMICKDQKPTSVVKAEEMVKNDECARWYLPSVAVKNRCIPTSFNETVAKMTLEEFNEAVAAMKLLTGAKEVAERIVEDIIVSKNQIAIGIGIGLVTCLIYIILLRWIAGIMVWLSMFSLVGLLSYCVYYSAQKYVYFKNYPNQTRTIPEEDIKEQKNKWICMLVVCSAILVIILLVLLVLRNRIKLAIELIREASKAISAVTTTLVFPIFPWILQASVIVFAIAVCLFLTTVGDPLYVVKNLKNSGCSCTGPAEHYEDGGKCDPEEFVKYCSKCVQATCQFLRVDRSEYVAYMQAVNIFGFFWGICFISALGQMILAFTFASWYWTFEKSRLSFFVLTEAIYKTIFYHTGTLAFGSLIIAVCKLVRATLEYVNQTLKKQQDNAVVRAIICCLGCCFSCLENFLQFINKNAYIMCAIHAQNFCTSTHTAFNLIMRNLLRVFILDKVCDFLFFLSKLLITCAVGCVSYTLFTRDETDVKSSELNYQLVPVVVIAFATYLIASIFFTVYSMAVDTLFLCFLEDGERNDGSAQKPYFMSKNLMRILGRKNV